MSLSNHCHAEATGRRSLNYYSLQVREGWGQGCASAASLPHPQARQLARCWQPCILHTGLSHSTVPEESGSAKPRWHLQTRSPLLTDIIRAPHSEPSPSKTVPATDLRLLDSTPRWELGRCRVRWLEGNRWQSQEDLPGTAHLSGTHKPLLPVLSFAYKSPC